MKTLSNFEKLNTNGGNCIESPDPAVTRWSGIGCAIGRIIGTSLRWMNPFK